MHLLTYLSTRQTPENAWVAGVVSQCDWEKNMSLAMNHKLIPRLFSWLSVVVVGCYADLIVFFFSISRRIHGRRKINSPWISSKTTRNDLCSLYVARSVRVKKFANKEAAIRARVADRTCSQLRVSCDADLRCLTDCFRQ